MANSFLGCMTSALKSNLAYLKTESPSIFGQMMYGGEQQLIAPSPQMLTMQQQSCSIGKPASDAKIPRSYPSKPSCSELIIRMSQKSTDTMYGSEITRLALATIYRTRNENLNPCG